RGSHSICVPAAEGEYAAIVQDPERFRQWLAEAAGRSPELFPEGFGRGFRMKDVYVSKKLGIRLRRIELRDGRSYTVRPSFVMPYLTARVGDAEHPLFLRKFGVPYWALARVFGRNPMYWFRLECGLGRHSVVGTTVRQAGVPADLVADEHHQTRDGEKVYLATTVGGGCCLGVEVAESAGAEDLGAAYGVFLEEARDVDPGYTPETVNTDGWKGTQAAWAALAPAVVLLRCFLHAWLKIRDRAKNLGQTFYDLSARVWDAYHSPGKRSFAQRLRRLREWAGNNVGGVVLEAVRDLCSKKELWLKALDHPGAHRTSNMLDRVMRPMYRYFFDGQHLHGRRMTERHVRAWALLWNFAPWSPATVRANADWRCPAERLNQHRYHDNWLQNLLISASLGGYRSPPRKA
ncbi:MAG: hypothetical protein M3Y33_22545, partial [Actinomycetota bacterium]|nr:hypothetical protein [Actinomycetota bacterium]